MKKIYIVGIVVLVLFVTLFAVRFLSGSEDDWICVNGQWVKHGVPSAPRPTSGCGETVGASSVKDATYVIEGKSVTLADGRAESEIAPGSASKLVTQYFGNEATGDLNGDGVPDVAFVLTQSGGGSGTFYYAVAAIGAGGGYRGTNAIFLGDRIAPQTTEIRNGEVIVNYADRKPGEPFSTRPSVGVSKYLKLSGETLVEASSSGN
jgi:hypothetical protein